MRVFDFLKAKKSSCPTVSNVGNAPFPNIDADIIMGRKFNQPNMLLFYRKHWAGKGDSGVDWIILKFRQGNCLILFKCAYADYGESLPSLENIKQKHCSIPLEEIKTWEYQKLVDFLCKQFDVTLSTDDCITEDKYNCWLEKIRLLSCVTDRTYKFNHGYADCACCLCFNGQEHFFYLKEIGNNKGYSLGQKVYKIRRESYLQFKNEQLDRETVSKHVCDLPSGDQDWLDDENFVEMLIEYATLFS